MLRFFKMLFNKSIENNSISPINPSLGSNNKSIKQIPQLLKLEEIISYHQLPDLYWVFTNNIFSETDDARKKICELLDSAKPAQLAKIDGLCRSRSSIDWFTNWHRCDPNEFIPEESSESDRILILGFASFHPNGYVREKAIKNLGKIPNLEIMPFLLIRMNDWVGVIREVSYSAIKSLLKPENAVAFVKNLQLVERLTTCSRAKHAEMVSQIFSLISSTKEAMEYGLKFSDPYVRRLCFKIAIDNPEFSNSTIFDHIKNDKSGQVRSYALRFSEKRINAENCKEHVSSFLQDKNMRVRVQALDIYCKYYLAEAKDILLAQLFSIYTGARETAIFYLKKIGITNIRELYINEISQSKIPKAGIILGLGVTGKKEDAYSILPFLSDQHNSIVKAVIKSLHLLKFDSLAPTVMPFLADKRPGVSREISNVLRFYKGTIGIEEISKYLNSSNPLYVRKNAFQILIGLNMYDTLPYILEFLNCGLPELEYLAKEALEKWRVHAVHAYLKPSTAQIQRITDLIQNINLDEKIKNEILFKIRP